jgi:hypothetical protein
VIRKPGLPMRARHGFSAEPGCRCSLKLAPSRQLERSRGGPTTGFDASRPRILLPRGLRRGRAVHIRSDGAYPALLRPDRTATPVANGANWWYSELLSEFGTLFLNGPQRSVNRKVSGAESEEPPLEWGVGESKPRLSPK